MSRVVSLAMEEGLWCSLKHLKATDLGGDSKTTELGTTPNCTSAHYEGGFVAHDATIQARGRLEGLEEMMRSLVIWAVLGVVVSGGGCELQRGRRAARVWPSNQRGNSECGTICSRGRPLGLAPGLSTCHQPSTAFMIVTGHLPIERAAQTTDIPSQLQLWPTPSTLSAGSINVPNTLAGPAMSYSPGANAHDEEAVPMVSPSSPLPKPTVDELELQHIK